MKSDLLGSNGRGAAVALLAIGLAATAAGLATGTERFWPGYFVAVLFYLTLALGAMAFVAIHHITNAAWWMPIRRLPEAMIGWMPAGAIMLLISIAGAGSLFHWAHDGVVPATGAMAFKHEYLTTPWYVVRMVIVLGVWTGLAYLLRRESLWQDRRAGLAATRRSRLISAVFLVVLAITITTSSVDWLMSFSWEFTSTLYGWYVFSGLFVAAMAATAIAVIWLRRRGLLQSVSDEHLHSLGKMIFAFATFWAYLWYCQFMLVYYAGLPEEGHYYASRVVETPGSAAFYATLVLGWGIPFVLLLGRGAKRRTSILLVASLSILAAHWLDLYAVVMPATVGTMVPGVVDAGLFACVTALFLIGVDRTLARRALVPHNDPYLEEALALGRAHQPHLAAPVNGHTEVPKIGAAAQHSGL